MNLINLLLCAIKTSLSYYRLGIMRGLFSLLFIVVIVAKMQCALDMTLHKFFAQTRGE